MSSRVDVRVICKHINKSVSSHSGPELPELPIVAHLLTLLGLDLELMLQHDHVLLTLLVLHLLLEGCAQRVEEVSAGSDLLVAEQADPPQTLDDALLLSGVREARELGNLGDERVFRVRARAHGLLCHVGPHSLAAGREVVLWRLVQEAKLDQAGNELREAGITQGATDDGLSLRDLVLLPEPSRVSVRVRNEGEGRVDVVRLCVVHQVLAVDLNQLAVLVQLGAIEQGKEDSLYRHDGVSI